MYTDSDGYMPEWMKWAIGGVILVGLGIATVLTLGATAPITGLAATLIVGAFTGAAINAGVGVGVAALTDGNMADAFMWGAITGGIVGAASAGLGTVAFSGSKLATAGLRIAENALISGGVTACTGLITDSFSWADDGVSSAFGAMGGGVGLKYSGARGLFIGIGLGLVEGGVNIAISKFINQATIYIDRMIMRDVCT